MCVALEVVLIHCVLPHEFRPRHVPRLNDGLASLSLGLLNLMITFVGFILWVGPLYR